MSRRDLLGWPGQPGRPGKADERARTRASAGKRVRVHTSAREHARVRRGSAGERGGARESAGEHGRARGRAGERGGARASTGEHGGARASVGGRGPARARARGFRRGPPGEPGRRGNDGRSRFGPFSARQLRGSHGPLPACDFLPARPCFARPCFFGLRHASTGVRGRVGEGGCRGRRRAAGAHWWGRGGTRQGAAFSGGRGV